MAVRQATAGPRKPSPAAEVPHTRDSSHSHADAAGRVSSAAMKYRALGRTGWNVSEISFGAWAIGGAWGDVSDNESLAALNRSIDIGVNFIDTADVYGDGRSERLVAQLKRDRP